MNTNPAEHARPADGQVGPASDRTDESAAPGGTGADPAGLPRSDLKGQVLAVLSQVGRALRPAWIYTRDAFRFYRDHWDTVRSGCGIGMSAALDNPELIAREVRLALHDQDGLVDDHGVWRVEFPARCVVCGAKASGDWIEERRKIIDPFGPIVLPLVGAGVGLILGWWYHSLLWAVGAPVGGVVAGYALRRTEEFFLRFKRCPRHADHKQIPELLVLNRQLLLRLGTREAKMAFMGKGGEYAPPDEGYVPPAAPAPPPPETIALAETVHPGTAIVPETPIRLSEDDDEEKRSDRFVN